MKKYLLSFAVLAMSMAMFNSCSKDKDEPVPELPAIITDDISSATNVKRIFFIVNVF